MARAGDRLLKDPRQGIDVLGARLGAAHPARRLGEERRRAIGLAERLRALGPRLLDRHRVTVDTEAGRLRTAGRRLLDPHVASLEACRLRLLPLSPFGPLERGYALVRRPDGRLVHRADQVAPGDSIGILLGAGALDATVNATRSDRDS